MTANKMQNAIRGNFKSKIARRIDKLGRNAERESDT